MKEGCAKSQCLGEIKQNDQNILSKFWYGDLSFKEIDLSFKQIHHLEIVHFRHKYI
jgi:hypothetical protein